MKMNYKETTSILESHLQNFFTGRDLTFDRWEIGIPQTLERLSRLQIAKFNPSSTEKEEWVGVSIGAWEFSNSKVEALEFMILAPYDTPRITELLTMSVNYHRTEHLGFGHVFSIGESWLEDSECDYFLVSLPYPFGADFEICHITKDFHVRFAWLLPITKAEKNFAVANSQEELERKLEAAGIEYSDLKRKSVL
jgi:hypothetical protein